MLKQLFHWLDIHPDSYWTLASAATALLGWRVGWSLKVDDHFRGGERAATWKDFIILFFFIFSWRWPFLLMANQLNPDESQLIAGAITLSHDPVFWRAVDGTTSGPLNFYLLVPFAWLGLPLDFFTARLTGLLLIGGALAACQRVLSLKFGRAVSWLAIIPAAFFFATATYSDLIHFSSEHSTIFLTGIAVWLLAGNEDGNLRRSCLAAFVAGLAVWAKLQAAPISAALIVWGLWQGIVTQHSKSEGRWRRGWKIGLAGIAPTLIAFTLIAITGQWDAAIRRYFLQNLVYVRDARPLMDAMREMGVLAMKDERFPLLLAVSLFTLGLVIALLIFRRIRPPSLFYFGALLTLSAVFAVVAPRREFLHYTLLLPIPLTLWLGAAIGGWWEQLSSRWARRGLAVALVILLAGPFLITRYRQPRPEIFGQFEYHWRHPRTSTSVLVHALAGRGDSLGIWGWAPEIYVENHLPQATRDAHSIWSIQPNAQLPYYRACYLNDLRRHRPAVFVDAVGSGAFALEDRRTQAHEIFPELAEYIHQNYTLVTDLGEARVYGRNDLAALRALLPARVRTLAAQGRLDDRDRATAIAVPITPLAGFQRKNIEQREVLMLLPPTSIEWLLSGDDRAVSLEFGFDPFAVEHGNSNGAGLRLEIRDADGIRSVFNCFLDPAHDPDARLPQKILVPLPSFRGPAHLVLLSDPGPYGDTAWDWVYLAGIRFTRGTL